MDEPRTDLALYVIIALMAAVVGALVAVGYGWNPWPYGLAQMAGTRY